MLFCFFHCRVITQLCEILKKNPRKRWTWHFCFEIIKNRPAFTSTQSASPQDWVWNCIYVSLFIHSFTYSYFWKKASIYFHSKCVTATLNFELIYLNVYFDCYFFLSINLIHIKHRHDISVLKSFNNSPACIYYLLPLKVPHREIEFWIVFMFLYLFIHSFTYSYFFYYYLFVSLYLIYINQVWHFCFEIVQ